MGSLSSSATEKTCSRCGETKPLTEFYRYHFNRDGHFSRCKDCSREVARQRYRELSGIDPELPIAQRTKHKPHWSSARHSLKMTHEEYRATVNTLLAQQGGKCAICGILLEMKKVGGATSACLDHCHTTLRVRGVLCSGCNGGLGIFRDNPEHLKRAAEYLGGVSDHAASSETPTDGTNQPQAS